MNDTGRRALKGRLADVYVPALVDGALEPLSRRLGNRATLDDPLYGRATNPATIEPMLAKVVSYFEQRNATYRHVRSTTGVDRDASEGLVALTIHGEKLELPIAVLAERRRLREIDLRIYFHPPEDMLPGRRRRAPVVSTNPQLSVPDLVRQLVTALRTGAVDEALATFEENAELVDPVGRTYAKANGRMAMFLSDLGPLDLGLGGAADDGRTCCVEATITRPRSRPAGLDAPAPASPSASAQPALLALERSESGLFCAMRLYFDT